ncbi:hypothetical protein B0H13DRAFT_1913065 [Mycena leptocephala]|nr:hypothetical protein B0H13DRAFT_1913065 [Mycena leptocephala]
MNVPFKSSSDRQDLLRFQPFHENWEARLIVDERRWHDARLPPRNSLAETSIATHLDGIAETCRYMICDQIPINRAINRLQTLVWFYIRVFEIFYDTLDVLCSSTRQKRPLRTGRVGPARLGALSYPLGIPVPSRKTAVFVTAVPFNGRVEALFRTDAKLV